MAKRPHSKYWCFTLYSDVCPWTLDNCSYCIYGRETCPDTGRKHLQGFVAFDKKIRLTAIKKVDPEGHYEMKRGTVAQAIEYCKKDGDFEEIGDIPDDNTGVAIRRCIEYAKEGNMDAVEELSPGLYLRYKRTFEGLRKCVFEPLPHPIGIWMYGTPGIGKDTSAIKLYNPYIKPHNKWWDGYADQEVVLWSDFDPDDMKYFVNYLKTWSDRYPFTAEYKGGSRVIQIKKFIVTSNYSLDRCLRECKGAEAIRRRFDIINCDTKVVIKRPLMVPDVTLDDLLKSVF